MAATTTVKEIVKKKKMPIAVKIILSVVIAAVLGVVLFTPYYEESFKDGGSKIKLSLTYAIVDYWFMDETKVYPVPYDLVFSGQPYSTPDVYWDKYEMPKEGISYDEKIREEFIKRSPVPGSSAAD